MGIPYTWNGLSGFRVRENGSQMHRFLVGCIHILVKIMDMLPGAIL